MSLTEAWAGPRCIPSTPDVPSLASCRATMIPDPTPHYPFSSSVAPLHRVRYTSSSRLCRVPAVYTRKRDRLSEGFMAHIDVTGRLPECADRRLAVQERRSGLVDPRLQRVQRLRLSETPQSCTRSGSETCGFGMLHVARTVAVRRMARKQLLKMCHSRGCSPSDIHQHPHTQRTFLHCSSPCSSPSSSFQVPHHPFCPW